jgi:hypothetical protein
VSDTSQGQDWWQASDLKWYPPEAHPNRLATAQPISPAPSVPWNPETVPTGPPAASGPRHAAADESYETEDDKEFDARIPLMIFLILFFIAVGVSAWIISLHN